MSVALSCCYCLSNRHLIGDCPYLPEPLATSSFSVRGINPELITNLNTSIPVPYRKAKRGGGRHYISDYRSPSPATSDDMLEHPDRMTHIERKPNRGSIQIGSDVGRNFDMQGSPDRRDYRHRHEYSSENSRQRSLSPSPNPPSRPFGAMSMRGGKDRHHHQAPRRSPSRAPRGRGRGGIRRRRGVPFHPPIRQ